VMYLTRMSLLTLLDHLEKQGINYEQSNKGNILAIRLYINHNWRLTSTIS
jgi:hypothetical protein